MYKQILIPDKKNHSVILPEDLYGKKIEVTVIEIFEDSGTEKKTKDKAFLDDIQAIPDFPGIEEIRKEGWPDRW